MGFVGNRSQYCTMGAVADWINVGDTNRLRAWLFSIAVAVFGVSLLEFQQWIDLQRNTSTLSNAIASLALGTLWEESCSV